MPESTCKTVIAVDPGHYPGYAVARRQGDGWRLIDWGTTRGNRIMGVLCAHTHDGPGLLVVEDQYIGKLNSIVGLIRDAQDWVCCARLLGWATRRIYPNAWISRAIGPTGVRAKRDARKAMARGLVDELGIGGCRTQDECDALCILVAVLGRGSLDVQAFLPPKPADPGVP